ncbi:MAG: glycerophosphodiester phosphodiesterase [Candidatus Heimdallarchaeaceae archaeon]
MKESRVPLIIAHRGSSGKAYQNSLEAFELAVEEKADMIELDTHLTKDGFFIVHHDPVIKHQGLEYVIKETDLETIKSLSLPNGESIPLLESVLKEFLPKIKFNVEIKCETTREQFDGLLRSAQLDSKRIIVSSFLLSVLKELSATELDYSLAYLYIFPSLKVKKVAKLGYISAMNPYCKLLTKKTVKQYHKLNKKVNVWTVDNHKAILKLLRQNVDGIITNFPLETRELIKKSGAFFH